MSDTVIRAEGLSKRYTIGAPQRPTHLREVLGRALRAPARLAGGGEQPASEHQIWALRDVSFEVRRGEVVAIIGRNGAGKSTLLKLLSRITRPTSGRIGVRGRVGSLLEVGTGFHPELSGRENISLNGAILGMRRAEIARKFDEIVAFAELERFVDTPVKHYSSGMYTRLAFAVAAHLEPEVLVVDEVLAVGDAAFQRKCLGKMGEVSREGRTVLFVSHNMAAVKSLCSRALLLSSGQQVAEGPVEAIVSRYLDIMPPSASAARWDNPWSAPGNERARLRAVRLLTADGEPAQSFDTEAAALIEIDYEVLDDGARLNCSLSLFTRDGTHVLASPSLTDQTWANRPHPRGRYTSRCQIPARLLNTGHYDVSVLLVERATHIAVQVDRAIAFEVLDNVAMRGGYFGHWAGVVRPILQWDTARHG